jgi:hypothetical protein
MKMDHSNRAHPGAAAKITGPRGHAAFLALASQERRKPPYGAAGEKEKGIFGAVVLVATLIQTYNVGSGMPGAVCMRCGFLYMKCTGNELARRLLKNS